MPIKSRHFAVLMSIAATLVAAAPVRANIVQVTDPNEINSDYFLWSQLGGDQTPIGTSALLTSQLGYLASVSLPGDDSLLQVVCPPGAPPTAPCSYQTQSMGFQPNDTLLVTSTLDDSTGTGGNGPLSLAFSTNLPSVGAWIQQDISSGAFQAELQVFSGINQIADFHETSDDNGAPVFIGALDSTPEITGAIFSLDFCGQNVGGGVNTPCSVNDFAIDTVYTGVPEPSTFVLIGAPFAFIALSMLRRRRARATVAAAAASLVGALAPHASAQALQTLEPMSSQHMRPIVKARIPSEAGPQTPHMLRPHVLGATLPQWSGTITSPLDGKNYPFTMVGWNPYERGARPVTLNIMVVPLIITMLDTNTTFDPTAGLPSQCIFNSEPPGSPLSLVEDSPIFQSHPYTMNGQNIGPGQYIDAFQRANFWSYVSLTGSGFHNSLNPTYTNAINLNVPANRGTTYNATNFGGCGQFALINEAWFDMQLRTMIGALAGANPTKFVLFLTFNAFTDGNDEIPGAEPLPAGCCVLGYHTAITPGAHDSQTYGFSAWDATAMFPGSEDISTLAHEVGEWMDDPYVDNLTPPWGGIGQVSGCYPFLEVGDPLSGTNFPAITSVSTGYVYHPQELAFFSWFYRQNPSIGAGGKFSNNGTLTSNAGQLCDTAVLSINVMTPVMEGTSFSLTAAVSTVAPGAQIPPVVAPTGTVDITDVTEDNPLCVGANLTTSAAPNNNQATATCGPFNTPMDPWAPGTHSIRIDYHPTGNWAPTTVTYQVQITM